MNQISRQQRRLQRLLTRASLLLLSVLILENQNHHRWQAAAAAASSSSKQYSASLVNHQQQQLQLQQQAELLKQQELDNVIESTTANLMLNQQQLRATPSNQQQQVNSRCQLPPTWAGRWLQSNKEPVRITNSDISDKGICRDQKGDKYLFEFSGNNNKQQEPCYYCLVINERHLNVLQYKESTCQPAPTTTTATLNSSNHTINNLQQQDLASQSTTTTTTSANDHSLLDSICSEITGDASLESLFRLDAPAIECPISGQYSFTYDACKETQSSLDSCIDKKQLNFKFSACQDVAGSESKSEVVKCYADWSEGNNYYMIGRLEYASNPQDRGKFRCFLYDKSPDGKFIQMSQTIEENCYGLHTPTEGPKTLRLTARSPTQHRCNFPSYIQSQSDNWLSVDNSLIYMFNPNSTKYQVKETKEGNIIEEAACLQQFTYPLNSQSQPNFLHPHHSLHQQHVRSNQQQQNRRYQADQSSFNWQISSSSSQRTTLNDVVYLVQITKNCQTTQYCVRFYKRSNGIVQIDYYLSSPNGDNQCRVAGTPQTQIITSTNLENQRCPFEGAYTIDAPIESDLTYNPSNIFICPRQSFLTAQCDHPSKLRIHSRCTQNRALVKNLYCLGSWTTGGLVRLLLADDERQRYSAWYREPQTLTPLESQLGLEGELPAPGQVLTRSQHLLSAASSMSGQQQLPFVDLNIALITPIAIKTMQVRLTKRNQCADLRLYSQPASSYSGAISSSFASNSNLDRSSSSSMLSYSPPSTSAAPPTRLQTNLWLLLFIVTTIFMNLTHHQQSQRRLTL